MTDNLNRRSRGVGAIACALRPTHHFDPIDIRRKEVREVEIASGIVDLHTIDQKQIRVLAAASRVDAGRSSAPAGIGDGESRNVAQQFINRRGLPAGDFRAIDNRSRNAEHIERRLDSRGGDDDVFRARRDAQRQFQ